MKEKQKIPKNPKRLQVKRLARLCLILLLGLFILAIVNFDRIATHLPSRYKFAFEQINDLIFGKVQVIEILGNNFVSKDEIIMNIYKNDVSKEDVVLINSVENITSSISKHPAIKSVNIKRFLPNKMVIYIQEKDIILRFYDEPSAKFFTISKEGEALKFYTPSIKVPLVIGKFNIEDTIKFYNKLLKFPEVVKNTSDILPFFEYRFDVVLKRKTLVNLPEAEVDVALARLQDLILNQNILEKSIKHIDLRVKGKIFIEYFKEGEPNTYKPLSSVTTLTWGV